MKRKINEEFIFKNTILMVMEKENVSIDITKGCEKCFFWKNNICTISLCDYKDVLGDSCRDICFKEKEKYDFPIRMKYTEKFNKISLNILSKHFIIEINTYGPNTTIIKGKAVLNGDTHVLEDCLREISTVFRNAANDKGKYQKRYKQVIKWLKCRFIKTNNQTIETTKILGE